MTGKAPSPPCVHLLEHGGGVSPSSAAHPPGPAPPTAAPATRTHWAQLAGALVIHRDETTADSGYAAMSSYWRAARLPERCSRSTTAWPSAPCAPCARTGSTCRAMSPSSATMISTPRSTPRPPYSTVRISRNGWAHCRPAVVGSLADRWPAARVYIGTELIIRQILRAAPAAACEGGGRRRPTRNAARPMAAGTHRSNRIRVFAKEERQC